MGEPPNRFVGVILRLRYAAATLEIIHMYTLRLTPCGCENHLESAIALGNVVFGAVLVAERMTANDDRFLPARNKTGNAWNDDRLAEYSATSVDLISDAGFRGNTLDAYR